MTAPIVPEEPSASLAEFIRWFPEERFPIYTFVREAAMSLAPGSRVYDIGAGDAPYRELFAHCDYKTVDWEHSVHPGARQATVISSADALQIEDCVADAVILTQVLEHVARPRDALREAYRILVAGGVAFITVPFAWELHEMPHDYWRFTPPSLQNLLEDAGFVDVVVSGRNDVIATLAQLLKIGPGSLGRASDGRDDEREKVSERMRAMAQELESYAGRGLDVRGIFPLGWSVRARRGSHAPVARGAAASNG